MLKVCGDMGGEASARHMDTLYEQLSRLVESNEVADNLQAIQIINELIDVRLGETATKIAKFADHLKMIFEEKQDPEVMKAASIALGHLARVGGALTADVVEYQVRRALEWLQGQGERAEARRFAAVLILKEMAENAPTVFNVHVSDFIEGVWVALRDPKLAVRECAVEALRACLCVIEKRETRWRVQWYYRMFERTQDGLGKNATVESIHGSLLAVGELLRNTREFMMSRYKEVAEIVFKYRDHRDRLVRRSITALLPRIANFLRDRFVTSYLKICMEHLLNVMRNPAERASGFIALGEMAGAVGKELVQYLGQITVLIREAISTRRGKPSMEALACIGNLAEALGSDMEESVRSLLELMFQCGLTPTLVDSLKQISSSMPSLLPQVQERLLESISLVLAKAPYRPSKAGAPVPRIPSAPSTPVGSEYVGPALTQLALQTLTNFDLQGHELLEFAREAVVPYLEDEDALTRRKAAVCCCRLVQHSTFTAGGPGSSRLVTHRNGRAFGMGFRKRRLLIEEILEKLLVGAVADTDSGVRKFVLVALQENSSFDEYLAQADSLRAIFIALTDESFEVRELAICKAGKLADQNPAYVLPALRRHLQQLLIDLEHSADSKNREESAKLLGCLIRSCERLLLPYIAPVLKALVVKLTEGVPASSNSGVVTGVLSTVGELARVGGCAMRPYLGELMPLIVEALLDGASASKREVAVATLGQVVESTGYVVAPYTDHPQLLGLLLRLLNGELAWSTRREVLKVLGIMGALDPHLHKRNQLSLQGSHGEGGRTIAMESGPHTRSLDDLPVEIWPSGGLFTTSEEYYPTVAINALMRILRESSLSSYHLKVVGSLMYIFKKMGLGSVPYLPKVLPDLFHTVRTCEDSLREFIFRCLAALVSIVRQHIRKYLPELLSLISDFWSSLMLPVSGRPSFDSPVLNLVEHLCLALNDEFRIYLPEILPRCVQVLTDAERTGNFTYVSPVLHTFEVFGGSLDEHMHLLLPALVRLFRPDVSNAPIEIRSAAIKTLARLLPRMQVSGHVSALMHPFSRVLDGNIDELRKDSVDAICALAVPLGTDFVMFIPSTRKLLQRHRIVHKQFDDIEARLKRREPVVLDMLNFEPATPPNSFSEVLSSPMHSFLGLDSDGERYDDGLDSSVSLKVNEGHLKSAWESSHRSTKEDWTEWMRHLSVELLKESPSPALRTCAGLAQLQPHVARELFAAGFVSCWSQLNENYKMQLVRSLQNAFSSPNIPPEILATLLNLAEFMEHDEKPIPIDIRTLGALAEKCHLYAKALHYKEMEFAQAMDKDAQPETAVEALIHINNQLHQHEAAMGILVYAQDHLNVVLKETWYEKLQRWEEALAAYKTKAAQATHMSDSKQEANLGQMRCFAALARWDELNNLCRESWAPAEHARRLEMAPMAASAAWNMEEWDEMDQYVSCLDDGSDPNVRMSTHSATGSGSGSSDGAFFRAVLCVRRQKYDEARVFIENARNCLATELAALVLESYDRAYSNMVRVQQLAELEEVIDFVTLPSNGSPDARGALIRKMWSDRILGTKKKVEVWQALLAVRTLAPPLRDDIETWLKFASLCRKSGRLRHAKACLVKLMQYDPEHESSKDLHFNGPPQIMLAYLKYRWANPDELPRQETFERLQVLSQKLNAELVELQYSSNMAYTNTPTSVNGAVIYPVSSGAVSGATGSAIPLLARVHLKLGTWRWNLNPTLNDSSIKEVLRAFRNATDLARGWSKAWHKWALFNTAVMSHYTKLGELKIAAPHVVQAVTGYFCSIEHASATKGGDDSLQDILRLLTLWFNHGSCPQVQEALQDGFTRVNIDTWLVVLPQIIARIHSNTVAVRDLIQQLLVKIGEEHPQALMYPLLVACKSISSIRRTAAQQVVDKVRRHSNRLVEEAQMVSKELIRVAILWHEMWHEALEEASRLYFGERNPEGMLNVLAPLHATLEKEGPVTSNEQSFVQTYGRELAEANEWCMKYRRTGKEAELTQAWDLYYHVFKRINRQLPSLTTLELQNVSPELVSAGPLEIAVPGTYRAGAEVVTISGFAPQLIVITSKQRPRKCTIHGSDGVEYAFLLKGHEDLRQDERVMQLFGLVNTLLANSRLTAEKDLSIQRYSVIPLSPNSGLIGWVPNCDTLHQLIREYRDARKVAVNMEHRLMVAFAPDYEHLTLMAKVEVFEHALDSTSGNDLAKVLWLKSRSSEVWLDRRTNYTRSLAVMSMVGYLLGLGDRHPSNLMLDRFSGKILHIDFGDCFEASMNREKFPEKVPFRLTRMLVKAMEVSGIEGNFRSTCESVMQVLRTNKDSVMAMMEAFVHDPLINWRLFTLNEVAPHLSTHPGRHNQAGGTMDETASTINAVGQLGDANEVLIERALAVMTRMSNKLTGRDFPIQDESGLSVKLQVDKLITQARSPENLCQSYVGWCPFW
ncbi:serine/threonine-protein kinase mTOR [Marchantia polymorpha subsp. ruderalis]|uniref:Serine/threonine-protein kinase TOR n=2 Tax=Marchantia polymorpha TaxID=3197 RepID=A0AAF6BS22_MARPO|nr:hypothetical protein MARPO_0047s0119 [Marchantia polymorpha]BBN14806.1 hypothetical protein Mp_6g14650 [Marchantia polymorpha subsp. ruderalis]|eukprot:PTQ39150.1 hypothetical protein MARPO_0047s0119 [Marchantia polymorpha]